MTTDKLSTTTTTNKKKRRNGRMIRFCAACIGAGIGLAAVDMAVEYYPRGLFLLVGIAVMGWLATELVNDGEL